MMSVIKGSRVSPQKRVPVPLSRGSCKQNNGRKEDEGYGLCASIFVLKPMLYGENVEIPWLLVAAYRACLPHCIPVAASQAFSSPRCIVTSL